MDQDKFEWARQKILAGEKPAGIGTLGEKTLHAIVKLYIEPDTARHELRIGPFFVDVLSEGRIYEIQTRQFGKLGSKLPVLLGTGPVTIVYPMPARKWLSWVDPETGAVSKRRLSPRRGSILDIFAELVYIKPFLCHPNLSILILQIDLDEYRLLNGWSRDKKRGSRRSDRVPLHLEKEVLISDPSSYARLMPPDLPSVFTSASLAKAASVSSSLARTILNVLLSARVAVICGKQGRSRLYRLIQD
jgi:hypothetical protein